MADQKNESSQEMTRRDFAKTAAVAAAATAAMGIISLPKAHADGNDVIKIGLIGCGGRGTGAVKDAFGGAQNLKLVAMADLFPDRLEGSVKELAKVKIDAPAPEMRFTGFDAYKKLVAIPEINYVIIAGPPGFRPIHLQAAIDAGKHVFAEKPVAVDPAGVRLCLAIAEKAKAAKLGIGTGTQRRSSFAYQETIKRIQDGAIGEIFAARAYWNQGGLWNKDRLPAWTDTEWQIRNWLYFTWLSGDHICEQHIHNIDVVNWAIGSNPVKCLGIGGRQWRTDPKFGHIYDHFVIEYEYANGARMTSMCRQMPNCDNNISEFVRGTKGASQVNNKEITGEKSWKFEGKDSAHYVQEHTDLIKSIRDGSPINNLKTTAESTLTAIMGRMSAYTGKAITWDQALNSPLDLYPKVVEFGPMAVPPVAIPGMATAEVGAKG